MDYDLYKTDRPDDNHESRKKVEASTYSEMYFKDDHCEFETRDDKTNTACTSSISSSSVKRDIWKSPSDCIMNLVDSIPPYTSRVLRSKTHFGILAMGENLIRKYDTFSKDLDKIIQENETVCQGILEHQMQSVVKKVKEENAEILAKKKEVFLREASKFYEKSLQALEDHLRSELQIVLIDLEAKIKRELNFKLSSQLETEKQVLNTILKEKVMYDLLKMKHYYQLLLANVIQSNKKLKNQALIESDDTLRAFLRQMDIENITYTMYVLCEERKKCQIRQFIVQNLQKSEIIDIKNKLKNRLDILNDLEKKDTGVYSMKSWEEKMTKIMQLFLKFIGFSLKLLPEQVTFLLDLEKMVVLQLNNIQKNSSTASSILVEKNNILDFEKIEPIKIQCNKKPFVIIGDLSEDVPTHKSTETLPSNVELPYIRVGREHIYARCENFVELKTLLESQQCKCYSNHEKELVREQVRNKIDISPQEQDNQASMFLNDSPIEPWLIDDVRQLNNCPVKSCNIENRELKYTFSDLDSFIDFTEDNYEKLKIITSELKTLNKVQKINPNNIVFNEVPFAETKERFCNTETQYSSQETLNQETSTCPCNNAMAWSDASTAEQMRSITSIMQERKIMLSKLVEEHPSLLNIVFTEQSYDLPF